MPVKIVLTLLIVGGVGFTTIYFVMKSQNQPKVDPAVELVTKLKTATGAERAEAEKQLALLGEEAAGALGTVLRNTADVPHQMAALGFAQNHRPTPKLTLYVAERLQKDPTFSVREAALKVIVTHRLDSALGALQGAADTETNEKLQAEIAKARALFGDVKPTADAPGAAAAGPEEGAWTNLLQTSLTESGVIKPVNVTGRFWRVGWTAHTPGTAPKDAENEVTLTGKFDVGASTEEATPGVKRMVKIVIKDANEKVVATVVDEKTATAGVFNVPLTVGKGVFSIEVTLDNLNCRVQVDQQ